MADSNSRTKTPQTETTTPRAAFAARIAELVAAGRAPKVAKKIAKRERRLRSPLHRRAIARKLDAATLRFEATGNVAAFKALEVRQ